jgi:DNA-binding SARP family transcriptional activator/tetratricopeptide (TPR) repeat protein
MIEIQSLGGIALTTSDGTQVRLRSRKHVGLLLYLAMSRHRLFRREHLTSLFWTSPPDRARHSLSQAVYDLRTHLGGALIRGPGEQLTLEGRGLEFDALEFETAVREGRLAEAIERYRGPFAQNLVGAGTREFDRWLESERLRLQRLAEVAFRRYAGECESKGRWGEMCVAAMRLTEMTPLDEDAHMCLMRGLWLHGDAAAALRHHAVTEQYLIRELPGGPSDRLSDLADRIRSAPSANPIESRVAERETPFLGRDREFDMLRSALQGMGSSRTTAVLIAGEAGIGKSRLVREFSKSVALEDVRLIESRCYPAEEELPYGPIVDAVSPIAREILAASPSNQRFARLGYLLPDFPKRPVPEDEGVDPAAWRRRLYEEVASLLRLAADRGPIVWIIDDAQWIDATSAGLLHYVSRRLEGTRFLLVVTVRAPRIGRLPAKLPVTPPDGSGYTQEIRLPPLTDDEIRELVLHGRPEASEHPAVTIAQRLSAGNPFYALEVFMAAEAATEWAQTLVDWDPLNDERLRHVLAVRFKGLPRGATRLLQCVSVLERNATPRMVAAVSGMELDDAADESGELYARGLLHDDEDRLDFVNDVMRDYVYGEMSGLRRASLHHRAGKQLELEPNPNPGTLARHFHLGDDRSLAYRYAMEAARQASESGGHAEAAAMAGLARRTAADTGEELAALTIMAESELASAQLADAREHFAEILRLQPDLTAEEKIRVQLRMVECSGAESNWTSVIKELNGIAPLLRAIPVGEERLELRIKSSSWAIKAATRQSDVSLARRHVARSRRARSSAARLGILSSEAEVVSRHSLVGYELFFGSLSRALSLAEGLTATDDGLPEALLFQVHLLLSSTYLKAADVDRAEHYASLAFQSASKAGDFVQQANSLNNLACIALEAGQWDRVKSQLTKIEERFEALQAAHDATLPLMMNEANVLLYQGHIKEAMEQYAECRRIARNNEITEFDPELAACIGLTALALGNRSEIAKAWDDLQLANSRDLIGTQERFKIEWFRGVMRSLTGDSTELHKSLIELANIYEDKDRLESAKLAWLAMLLTGQLANEEVLDEELTKLGRVGLRWFGYFSRRLMRQIQIQRTDFNNFRIASDSG